MGHSSFLSLRHEPAHLSLDDKDDDGEEEEEEAEDGSTDGQVQALHPRLTSRKF